MYCRFTLQYFVKIEFHLELSIFISKNSIGIVAIIFKGDSSFVLHQAFEVRFRYVYCIIQKKNWKKETGLELNSTLQHEKRTEKVIRFHLEFIKIHFISISHIIFVKLVPFFQLIKTKNRYIKTKPAEGFPWISLIKFTVAVWSNSLICSLFHI